jgi:UDP-2,4-diacetamido-2,4,6-trideoxy-beta-L-altropyranose hydrolase
MKIGFYTFGGSNIGTGHLFRCIALTQWFERTPLSTKIQFEIIDSDPAGPAVAMNIITKRTEHPFFIHKDPALPGAHWDVLIVDRLQVPLRIMESLRLRARFMVSIDDVGPGRYLADIALNPLYRSTEAHLPHYSFVSDYQGPEFQIIAPAFSDSPSRWQDSVTDLLITQGGADRHGLVARIINDLEPLLTKHKDLTLHVLTGPGFLTEKLSPQIMHQIGSRLVQHTDVTDMAALLRVMDLAVSAAGVTPFELAAIGLPAVLVTGEAKEVETANEIVMTGAALSLGLYSKDTGELLRNTVDSLMLAHKSRAVMRQSGLDRLDGRMGERLVDMINKQFRVLDNA